ncbi:hypothetical protein N7523_006364 [Penicillium sp. IBT 18751x]|nr:hypothetical protein N7523_006364 [Penicillium sp. IBT 18751x]
MSGSPQVYNFDHQIAEFFEKTSATRQACDAFAKEHLGGDVVPVPIQGECSYTVYAGVDAEYVVQFRLKTLELNMKTSSLAREIYGNYAPEVSCRGSIGEDTEDKDLLYVYVMSRVQGISYLEFILKHSGEVRESSPDFSLWRRHLMVDFAKFFALSWKTPQVVDPTYRDNLFKKYVHELDLLRCHLPLRFLSHITRSIESMQAIKQLPMVLVHWDFGVANIMVNEQTCNLIGVVDWAEAEIAPFGINLSSLQWFISKIHFKNGWSRFDDYVALEDIFWTTFRNEVGLDDETIQAIQAARIAGLLLSRGYTSRLANMPESMPINDDEKGAYNMRDLDGLLINPATRFTDLA